MHAQDSRQQFTRRPNALARFVPGSTLRSLLVLALCAACNAIGDGQSTSSTVHVINASNTRFDALLDGDAISGGDFSVSAIRSIPVAPGTHQVRFVTQTGTNATVNFTIESGKTVIAYAYSGGASLNAAYITDTGSVVPANKSKLRVSHLSANAGSIELWRTQPDFQTPVHIMTPFNYLDTSPYLQSDPGVWEVFATRPGSTAKIATTGAVDVPAGERRTVVLIDSLGVLRFRVLGQ
jgi:hypothetical protein